MNPEDARIHDLVVEACALTQRLASEAPVDERAWATVHHLRVALCVALEQVEDTDTRDAACGAINELDRVAGDVAPARWGAWRCLIPVGAAGLDTTSPDQPGRDSVVRLVRLGPIS